MFKNKTMKKDYVITSKKQYHEILLAIYELINGGEKKLTKVVLKRLSAMVKVAEKYEEETLELQPDYQPDNLPDMVKSIMLEAKISQGKLAKMLEVRKPKLSRILNGKKKPDVEFLKLAYKKLNIDPAFILEHA